MIKLDSTKKFYEEVKSMSFFRRLFSWGKIIPLLTESYAEISKFEELADLNNSISSEIKVKDQEIKSLSDEINKHEKKIASLENDIKHLNQDIKSKESEIATLNETKKQNTESISKLNAEIEILKFKRDDLTAENKKLSNEVTEYRKVEQKNKEESEKALGRLQKTTEDFDNRRVNLENDVLEKEKQRLEAMKETWKNHEINVEQHIKRICGKYDIDYFGGEKVPFKGKPDNSIKIANEFIIFDAKSPANDDLNNFPKYIKSQTESLKKYAKENEVKKDIFLVVPTNVIDKLPQTFYDMSDYRVYVITIDSLEPIILSLQKIETYEFAEKLSPEDRESICRVLGHFAHHTKRRMQIDTFLADKSLELLKSCEYLPDDILESVKNHELKSIVNVPMDKRTKKSDLKKLATDKEKLVKELEIRHINTKSGSEKLESIELYDGEEDG